MIALLLGLYLSQGLPFGFFTQALPVLMRQQGVDLGTIGLANLLALPWALKFLWAPAIDRVPGPRKRVILPLQGIAGSQLRGAQPEEANQQQCKRDQQHADLHPQLGPIVVRVVQYLGANEFDRLICGVDRRKAAHAAAQPGKF